MAVVHWASCNNVRVESIDEDAMGGMAVYLSGQNGRTIWVCLRNNIKHSIVARDPSGKAEGFPFSIGKLHDLRSWLQEGIHCPSLGNKGQ
jgi:hypothetical protein